MIRRRKKPSHKDVASVVEGALILELAKSMTWRAAPDCSSGIPQETAITQDVE